MARKKPPEQIGSKYSAIPWALLDSRAFQGCSFAAKALLYELARQLDGWNNGHLQLTTTWLKKRGWHAVGAIQRAKTELIERGLIIQTLQGGQNLYPSRFAVTWLHISNFVGLEIGLPDYRPGKWRELDDVPVTRKPMPKSLQEYYERRSAQRNSSAPASGTATPCSAPPSGTEKALFGASAVPASGDDVSTNTPCKLRQARQRAQRITLTMRLCKPASMVYRPVAPNPNRLFVEGYREFAEIRKARRDRCDPAALSSGTSWMH